MSSNASSQVRVGVRIRPLTSNEIKQGGKQALEIISPCVSIAGRRFTYDAVFDSYIGQQELYENVSNSLLASFIDGYNATIMAYGQTGSGKTFTMGSEAHSESDNVSHTGLIPRFLADIFARLQQQKEYSAPVNGNTAVPMLLEYKISASFLEVYGEDVHDLLDRDRKSLPLREDSNGGIVIAGLTHRHVKNATEALAVLNEGTMNRTTAATLMNLTSSRSHAVFTIHLSQTTKSEGTGDVEVSSESRFTFVDLAGSERMKKTGAEGERAREGIKINEGLLALGNVINALADEERLAKEKKVHVPYRQSKLTRLLQDALGGNSQTLFLACVSPSDTNANETLSTLHYANRARNIKNAPTKNIDGNILELQRLTSLTRVLQCELIKHRFQEEKSSEASATIGKVDDELLQRSDVLEYMQKLQEAASLCQESQVSSLLSICPAPKAPSLPKMEITSPLRRPAAVRRSIGIEATPNRSILEKFDEPMLDELDPDAEMAILDQLLEVQQNDQKFDQEQKEDKEKLKKVEGELAEQEIMLLQLKESLKVYHNMKEKYEILMAEVQQLEGEKEQLVGQLEKAKADPSTGCSASIKKKLEKVEQSLTRARSESRKQRQKYIKAEQEAQKCKVLGRKIAELKQGKVALLKKQRADAVRHREFNEKKTREIMALKRKERTTEQKMSKLRTEIQQHKNNLEKRKNYSEKLSQKLKQTESHLMKLLSLRNRQLRDRTSSMSVTANRRRSTLLAPLNTIQEDEPTFAPLNEEVKSLRFMIEKMAGDKATNAEIRQRYEERVAEYSELMGRMVTEVKNLEKQKKAMENDDDSADSTLLESQQALEDLELRVDLLRRELEDLEAKLPKEESVRTEDSNPIAVDMVAAKGAPILRTLLLETVEMYSRTELERRAFSNSIQRKDCALRSLENEVESLTRKVAALSQDLSRRRRLSDEDKVEALKVLEDEKIEMENELKTLRNHLEERSMQVQSLETTNSELGIEYASAKEKLAIAEAIVRQNDGIHPAEVFLQQAQKLWNDLGVDLAHRESFRQQIESCLEDTCSRKFQEDTALKEQTTEDIARLETRLEMMRKVLGMKNMDESSLDSSTFKLLDRLKWLKAEQAKLQPSFDSATERRDKIVRDANDLVASMMLSNDSLSEEVQMLLNKTNVRSLENVTMQINDENDLSDEFLSTCEEELSSLRLKKARILVRNTEMKQVVHKLVQEMNLSEDDVVNLALHSFRQRKDSLPSWWNQPQLAEVAKCSVQANYVIPASQIFLKHLEVVKEALSSIANGRRELSTVLQEIVNRAQRTLLDTVEQELDASEAYSSFHDELFKLPPLSKEFVDACITEIDALVLGVDTMSQSEIEALTVVWEALSVSMSNRGKFWSDIDESTKAMSNRTESPFDSVLRTCADDKEQWVLLAIKNCRSSYKKLEIKLFKLERIHKEVERLRSKQDSKSKIISLDSELRILSAKLSDFENERCNKQRLLTKKIGSSALLKEERFRKQMQAKYSATLEQLAALLKKWRHVENENFDNHLLSNEVRALLEHSDGIENWVEKRTEFMHLRMTTSAVKRKPERSSRLTPPRKRPGNDLNRRREPLTRSPSASNHRSRPLDVTGAMKKRKATEKSSVRNTLASKISKLRTASPNRSTPSRMSPAPKARPTASKRESSTLLPFGKVLSNNAKENSPFN